MCTAMAGIVSSSYGFSAEILVASDMPVSAEYTIPGMTIQRIDSVVEAYGNAAARVVESGFDAIEFHCGHTYLQHSFLSGGINHRADEYGGSLKTVPDFRWNVSVQFVLIYPIVCLCFIAGGGIAGLEAS